ncbi:ribonucleotide-diphosphate reductase subunit beta [Croceibacterium mercuriale]|uniref:Ribosomal protein L11 methyltransferase n=1 Tax=Croceibacterium mercuriale TaxID=1572751 RepID=A0A0B2C130_9SPHN|nr:50S ribosomal protein L11 methyltransferase [Croceibacterium mercuriale]KHL25666.1 ribonucleotide-diphosphate reductase subunit beta [Croceibacterium mercuriale]
MSWKLLAHAPRDAVRQALVTHERMEETGDWDSDMVLTGSEVAEDRPHDWQLEAYLPRKPLAADRKLLAQLFGHDAPEIRAEKLPDTDWVTETQRSVTPIRAGRFHVHTPDFPADPSPEVFDFTIPAAQAFGTGQHATTAGCLAMLDAMKQRGVTVRDSVDIGTGTGLLAFAALALWPRNCATASDIDAVCDSVVAENCRLNGIAQGPGPGALAMVVAPGTDHPLTHARAPYDLIMANILAGPLIELAGDFAELAAPRGNLVLAGLLQTQEAAVRAAYRTAGFRLAARIVNGDWSILWLRRRWQPA